MSDEVSVETSLTPEQQKEMIDTKERKWSFHRKTIKTFEEKQKELMQKGEPFCFRCAKIDFEEKQKKEFEKPGSKTKFKTERQTPVVVNVKDYFAPKRFKLVKETEKLEEHRRNGDRVTYVTVYKDFCCLERGCRISVQKSRTAQKDD